MKVFNARAATEEYMSTHSLTFSTPEMTLRKFAMWLGEPINIPGSKEGSAPRMVLYLEEKTSKSKGSFHELMPDINDTFKPSGAVTNMYDLTEARATESKDTTSSVNDPNHKNSKFCTGCGSKISLKSKYCTRCGVNQGD